MSEDLNTNVSVTTEETDASGVDTAKTYTADEVAAMLQSESDKRVTAALKKQQAKFDKQLSLAKLDDNERAKAERDERIAELEQQLAEFQIERNKSELKSVLASRNLSAEFADIIIINDDIETSQANIDKLDKLFKAAVKAEVEKRLAGSAPKGNVGATGTLTKENLKNMSLADLQKLKQTNPELYNNLYN